MFFNLFFSYVFIFTIKNSVSRFYSPFKKNFFIFLWRNNLHVSFTTFYNNLYFFCFTSLIFDLKSSHCVYSFNCLTCLHLRLYLHIYFYFHIFSIFADHTLHLHFFVLLLSHTPLLLHFFCAFAVSRTSTCTFLRFFIFTNPLIFLFLS